MLPAVIIHTANPHMIENWLIKHVTLRYGKAYIDGALYKANDNNLSEPSTQTDQDEVQQKQTRNIAPRTSCTKFEQSRTREQKLEARLLQTLESTLKQKSEEAQELRARVRILENHFNQKSTENADFINSLGLVPTQVLVPHYILEDSTENESEERQGISDRDSGVESESQ